MVMTIGRSTTIIPLVDKQLKDTSTGEFFSVRLEGNTLVFTNGDEKYIFGFHAQSEAKFAMAAIQVNTSQI